MKQCSCGGVGCKLCKRNGPEKTFIPVDPMGAVRTTQGMKGRTETGKRYANYKHFIGIFLQNRISLREPLSGPIRIDITFHMAMPKKGKVSRKNPETGKRKMYAVEEGEPHIAKPDVDNLIKGVFDSFNKVIWADDNQVYEVTSRKVYGETPGIEFSLWEG